MTTAAIKPGLTAAAAAAVRAVVYLRISRDDQKQGLGVARQLELCERLAALLGWTIVAVVDENDTSATRRKPRPKYQAMLADIRRGKYDAILAYAQDRLTRKPREAEDILDLADTMSARVATYLTGAEVNFSDPDARFNFRNSTSGAAREIEMNKKRSLDERAQRAQDGKRNGPLPFGWRTMVELSADGSRVVGTRQELHPVESALIVQAARLLLQGLGLRTIATRWNADGFTTPLGNPWRADTVRKVMLRASNAGIRVHQGTELTGVECTWPAILDEPTYRRVVALLKDPARATNNVGTRPRWLLSGILTCARCGDASHVSVSATRGRPHYVCSGTGCGQRLNVADADTHVGALVEQWLANPRTADPADNVQAELEAIAARRDAIVAEQAQAGELQAQGLVTLAQLVSMNQAWNAALVALDDDASALLPDVAAEIDLPDGWDGEQDLDKRRAVVRQLFARLELVPNPSVTRGKARIYRPEDIRHQWR